MPIEVKFRLKIDGEDRAATLRFLERHGGPWGLLVTRDQTDERNPHLMLVPLRAFLLAF